jgi:hypothetical protein
MADALHRLAARGGVLAIDGRSGSGKSTLALALGAPVVSLEDLYGGWDGLRPGIDRLVREVLEPLRAAGRAGVPRWDWHAGRWERPRELVRPALLAAAPSRRARGGVARPARERRARALARDGAELYPDERWAQWAAQEDEYLASDDPIARADLVLTG